MELLFGMSVVTGIGIVVLMILRFIGSLLFGRKEEPIRLVTCAACRAKVSEFSGRCVHCGHPVHHR